MGQRLMRYTAIPINTTTYVIQSAAWTTIAVLGYVLIPLWNVAAETIFHLSRHGLVE